MSTSADILLTYGRAVRDLPLLSWGVLAVPVLLAFLRIARPAPRRRWPAVLLLAVVLASGLALAWQLRWIGDDAYISFRFARNLAEGHGLVFNVGERVEGYTAFLGIVLLAGAIALGIHPVHASLVLTLSSYVAAILTIHRATRLMAARASGAEPSPWPTLGAALAASGFLMASHATSGLTTMFAAALVLASYWQAEMQRPLLSGMLGIAAALAHPDHGLFYAAMAAALLLRRARLPELLRYAAPFVFVFVPYFLWRWSYYGDLVPNTFRCKSADMPYWSQGWVYVLASLTAMGAWAMLPLAGAGAWRFRSSRIVPAAVIGVPAFLAYTARIGGDFMLGRYTVTPCLLLILLASLGFEAAWSRRPRWLALAPAVLAATAMLPARLIAPETNKWYLADEGTFYELVSVRPPRVDSVYALEADALKENVVKRGVRPKLATDCVGIVGYETGLPLFDLYGLTSREVAMSTVWVRGRPGHERYGTPGQVLASGAELSKIAAYPPPYDEISRAGLGPFTYYIPAYRSPLGPMLTAAGRTRDPAIILARLADALPQRGEAVAACDTWFAREFYFRHQSNPELADRWVAALSPALPRDEAVALLLQGRGPDEIGYRPEGGFTLDAGLRDWILSGPAAAGNPVASAVRGQEAIVASGALFIDTFQPAGGDAPTGRLVSPPLPEDAALVTFAIAGTGRGQHVRLLQGDRVVLSAATCGCDTLRREAWPLARSGSDPLRLEIVDGDESGAGGHVIVDDIRFWARE